MYLTALEQAFVKLCPGTNKRANPHMHSKMGTFKRDYNMLSDYVGKSGGGFDYATNTFDTTPELWEELQQHVSTMYTVLKNKSWPYYRDWVEIFGKDRANGEYADDGDVTQTKDGESRDAHPEDPLLESGNLLLSFTDSPFEDNDNYYTHDESNQEDTSYVKEGGNRKRAKKSSKNSEYTGSADRKKKTKCANEFDVLISELRELSRDSNAAIKELGEALIRPGLVL